MKIQNVSTKQFFELVISDGSGEAYSDYISNDELIEKDRTIAQADKLLLFVDSTQLYNRSYRSFKDDYTSLMHRLKDKGKLPSNAIVYLIFNKIDLKDTTIKDRPEREEAIKSIVVDAFEGREILVKELDSKSLAKNQNLEKFFISMLTPRDHKQDYSVIDWVNNDI